VYGNTELGMHAAALGGSWQIVVYGFAGVKVKDNMLKVNPVLPESWHNLSFQLWFKKVLIEFNISKNKVEAFIVKSKARNQADIGLEIYGKRYFLNKGERINVKER